MSDLHWLTDEQMARLRPFLPKSHDKPRVDDRQVLSGIVFVNRNGLRWRDAPKDSGPHKTRTGDASLPATTAAPPPSSLPPPSLQSSSSGCG